MRYAAAASIGPFTEINRAYCAFAKPPHDRANVLAVVLDLIPIGILALFGALFGGLRRIILILILNIGVEHALVDAGKVAPVLAKP